MPAGVILAQNLRVGESFKTELGLDDWLVMSPRSIINGAGRGRIIDPFLLIIGGTDPYPIRSLLAPCFGPHIPAVYWITGGAL